MNDETNGSMGLDDDVAPAESEKTVAKDNDGVPYCRVHHCRMKAYSSGRKGSQTTYYKCLVSKCDETAKMIRTRNENIVPKDPLVCPRCSGGAADAKKSLPCERDDKASTAAMVILKCPVCGWKSNGLAVPQFAATMLGRRSTRRVDSMIGDR